MHLKKIAVDEKAEVGFVIYEAEIAELYDEGKMAFMAELKLDEPGLDRLIHAGYKLLHLETYFTAGVKEVRAWTIPVSATAPQAAGVIHTDFEKGFIRAEVISYTDFIHYKGEHGAKEAGKWRLEGKDYIVQDGDVMHFRFKFNSIVYDPRTRVAGGFSWSWCLLRLCCITADCKH